MSGSRNEWFPPSRDRAAGGSVDDPKAVLGRFGVGLSQVAVAAENSHVSFQNPGGSGVIAILDKVIVSCETAGLVRVSMENITLAGITIQGKREATQESSARCRVQRGSNAGVLINSAWVLNLLAATNYDVLEGGTLRTEPGDELTIALDTVNLRLNTIWRWREISLDYWRNGF